MYRGAVECYLILAYMQRSSPAGRAGGGGESTKSVRATIVGSLKYQLELLISESSTCYDIGRCLLLHQIVPNVTW